MYLDRSCETVGEFSTRRTSHALEISRFQSSTEYKKSFSGFSFSSRVPFPGSGSVPVNSQELTNALRRK